MRDEIPDLRGRLEEAGQGHFDADADIAPIRALLDQGCDLEGDILPTVARTVPELPRPLKRWGAALASANRLPLIDGQPADRWVRGPSSDR
jgi:hypothetical protein